MYKSLSPLVRGNSLSSSYSLSTPQGGIQGLGDRLERLLADGMAKSHHARTVLLQPPPLGLTAMMQLQNHVINYDTVHLLTSTMASKATQTLKTLLSA
ncbi:hypothetical protein [Candidatus Sodalis sp. SoCistrobi]|uniref:hypothetical protein n=1 Tax=Candidatus Sodalis sp. SoCistrobi TaxID=1922216 RepID=UPI00093ABEE9|nr:hypothetical protein [Candidatus Sodalis sp. SoCistrobi]